MSKRRKRPAGVVPLPWEGRGMWFSDVLSLRRIRPLIIASGVLALGLAAYDLSDNRTRQRATRSAISEVHRAIAAFRSEMERCPRSTVELVHPPKAGAQYLDELPRDGWDRELEVRCPGSRGPQFADVVSAGPSGRFDVDDNIL